MSSPEINYFTCTLGEAAHDDIRKPFRTVTQLIDQQARAYPDSPAVGFFRISPDNRFIPRILTFKHVKLGVLTIVDRLSKLTSMPHGSPVGLLAASSEDFFFTWLACIWLGHPVLLVAPQCSAAAIAHLAKTCDVSILLADEKHRDLAEKACKHAIGTTKSQLSCLPLPGTSIDDLLSSLADDQSLDIKPAISTQHDVAYLHHTSGTSSGLPKPIPQSHHGAVGVLPALNGRAQATFTTTPLYHGGPADIFRAWTSHALIWLFPSKDVPITANNVTRCLESAQSLAEAGQAPTIQYFTSVPYVLQMMAEDDKGLELLQNMDLVGVGGAALATEIGDKLTAQGVHLVSRFGAAECGFMLSSHRNYDKDHAWQYLRHKESVTQIRFELRDEDLYELVIRPDWPHMAKRNCEDGSYTTSDLFIKHPSLSNAWKYHSRADSQLTLVTGKKFDPAPLESAIVAASTHICDALVFGNGKPYPGVLLFRSKKAEETHSEEIFSSLAPLIEQLNTESQSHARVPRNMLVLMDFRDSPLEKSSKGTILRNRAEEVYATDIEAAYAQIANKTNRNVSDEDLPTAILELVGSIVTGGGSLSIGADLFAQGVDSVACVQIRHGLSLLLPNDAGKLPLTVVEDSRTVEGLAELIKKLRHGGSTNPKSDQRSHILELVHQYSDLGYSETHDSSYRHEKPRDRSGTSVLLTGPTGSLGACVLGNLLMRPDIQHVYLLVRGASPEAARERVFKALSTRLIPVPADVDQRITIYQCKLSENNLGLTTSDYNTLQANVDLILHLAWSVNFLLSLRSFAPHFAGIRNLLKLTLSCHKPEPPRLIFCSSVASMSQFANSPTALKAVPEKIVTNINSAGSTGYALSKLTAELILARTATTTQSLHKRITILRVGQLSADTQTGVWNKSEAYPQILASAKFTGGLLPDLGDDEKLTWLPLDIAAKAFVEASLTNESVMNNMPSEHIKRKIGQSKHTHEQNSSDKTTSHEPTSMHAQEIETSSVRVLHLINPDINNTFTDFLTRLQTLTQNGTITKPPHDIQIVPANQWLDTLDTLQANEQPSSPAQPLFRLLPFWKDAYATRQSSHNSNVAPRITNMTQEKPRLKFDIHNSLLTMPSLTYWLGLNTFEGQKAEEPEMHHVDIISNGVNGYEIDRREIRDRSVQNELLRSEYVGKLWKWVVQNVP